MFNAVRRVAVPFEITADGPSPLSSCRPTLRDASVTTASKELDSSAYQLAQGSSEQAATLQEIAGTIQSVDASVGRNAQHAKDTARMANDARMDPEREQGFRQFQLNQWGKGTFSWMPMDRYDKANRGPVWSRPDEGVDFSGKRVGKRIKIVRVNN